MRKYIFLIVTLFGAVIFSNAQSVQDTLVVVPGKQGMYIYHVVTKEETLYSLSRKYHVDPKELADFNHLTLQSRVRLFQLVKIPLNKENFDQSSGINTTGLIPLYHKVLKGETLYHISQLHDKVSGALLQKWNGLSGNEVRSGQYLIVGWLKKGGGNSIAVNKNVTDKDAVQGLPKTEHETTAHEQQAASAKNERIDNNAGKSANPGNNNTSANNNGAFLSEVIASENASRNIHTAAPVPVDENNDAFFVKTNGSKTPVSKTKPEEEPALKKDMKASADKKVVVKKEAKISPPRSPVEEKPDSFDIMLNRVTRVPGHITARQTIPATNENSSQTSHESSTPAGVGAEQAVVAESAASAASEFEQQYMRQTENGVNIASKKGAAGWFKSNVKPGSGRYYALCNDLPRGTIVKVINPLNQKSILVKILDALPQGAENYNLLIKISDAATGELGVTQSRFWCEIQYPKQ
ncbi:MAG: LysM peptidoglycan-binding domain-containing protein [Chitinophagaceae bacterium]|nr:MAG: LysM peptidoglycan-binding domain-containing protein [Chitinophagaceae bacterium]